MFSCFSTKTLLLECKIDYLQVVQLLLVPVHRQNTTFAHWHCWHCQKVTHETGLWRCYQSLFPRSVCQFPHQQLAAPSIPPYIYDAHWHLLRVLAVRHQYQSSHWSHSSVHTLWYSSSCRKVMYEVPAKDSCSKNPCRWWVRVWLLARCGKVNHCESWCLVVFQRLLSEVPHFSRSKHQDHKSSCPSLWPIRNEYLALSPLLVDVLSHLWCLPSQ